MATMINSGSVTVPKLEIFAEQINEACPILDSCRSSQKDLKGRDGGKITVCIPDVGVTKVVEGGIASVGVGGDIPDTSIKEFSKTLTVSTATNAASADSLSRSVTIDDFEREVSKPRSISIARAIEQNVISKSAYCSDTSTVISTGGLTFEALSNAAGTLGDLECGMDLVGFLSHTDNAIVAHSGTNDHFLPPNISEGLYKDAKIGLYSGVDFFKTKMPLLTFATANVFSGATITAVDGTSGTITVTGLPATTTTVLKGTAFTIEGIYVLDLLGNGTGILKTFVVGEDATVSSTSATLNVGAFSNSGAHANVSAIPTTSDTITAIVGDSVSSYRLAWIFQKYNVEFDAVKLSDEGLQVITAVSSNKLIMLDAVSHANDNRVCTYRFDSAYIAGGIDSRRSHLIYIKV